MNQTNQEQEKQGQHTPGPWKMDIPLGSDFIDIIVQPGFGEIARIAVNEAETIKGPTYANAKLIAAAPDMLQALKDVDRAYQQMFDVMPVAFQTFAHIVEAAISKAEGRSEEAK